MLFFIDKIYIRMNIIYEFCFLKKSISTNLLMKNPPFYGLFSFVLTLKRANLSLTAMEPKLNRGILGWCLQNVIKGIHGLKIKAWRMKNGILWQIRQLFYWKKRKDLSLFSLAWFAEVVSLVGQKLRRRLTSWSPCLPCFAFQKLLLYFFRTEVTVASQNRE